MKIMESNLMKCKVRFFFCTKCDFFYLKIKKMYMKLYKMKQEKSIFFK